MALKSFLNFALYKNALTIFKSTLWGNLSIANFTSIARNLYLFRLIFLSSSWVASWNSKLLCFYSSMSKASFLAIEAVFSRPCFFNSSNAEILSGLIACCNPSVIILNFETSPDGLFIKFFMLIFTVDFLLFEGTTTLFEVCELPRLWPVFYLSCMPLSPMASSLASNIDSSLSRRCCHINCCCSSSSFFLSFLYLLISSRDSRTLEQWQLWSSQYCTWLYISPVNSIVAIGLLLSICS